MKNFPYEIRGASILIVIDHNKNDCVIKLIDLASITEYENKADRDQGFIFGLTNMIK